MSEHPGTATAPGQCPSCRARVAPGQEWCTLCHARLDARGDAGPDAGPHAGPAAGSDGGPVAGSDVGPDARSDARPGPDGPAGPSDAPGEPAGALPGLPAGVSGPGPLPPGAAEAMLAELAATTAAERPLSSGPLSGTSRGVRTLLAVGAAVVLVAVGVGLLTLVGLLL
ncbi:hypothetical protein [Jannaschia sp. R86511]|uniref:hypothetical protein n=1 Tax=Jannaschia sp. R86511 TaxID=3093853 RepID=UPI0036D41D11